MTRFRTLQMSLDLIGDVKDLVTVIRRRSTDLARQLERASSSVALNIAEANRREGKDRSQRFRIAAGEAAEVRTALQVAQAWGYVKSSDVTDAFERIDGLLGMLWVLSHGRKKNPSP